MLVCSYLLQASAYSPSQTQGSGEAFGEGQDSCSRGFYFELTPNVSCPLFPGSLLLELGHMRHLGLCLCCVDRHSFPGESSVLAGTAI